jgi:predicted ATPase
MKLERLIIDNYRSLREIDLPLYSLNVMIGTNASGKSNILDALRFLNQGVHEKDFARAVRWRGNVVQLAWKGAQASYVQLEARFSGDSREVTWKVRLDRQAYEFDLSEVKYRASTPNNPPEQLLSSDNGRGWWWSDARQQVRLSLPERSGCALAAAAVDESFSGRGLAEFVNGWGFFDPSPALLRRPTFPGDEEEGPRLDAAGRNLAMRLFAIEESKPDIFKRIVSATNDVLGVPESIETRRGDDGRIYFVQTEVGLNYPVHQLQSSSGTLRMLALMTAMLGEDDITIIGIEEPENYIHPNALGLEQPTSTGAISSPPRPA